MRIVGGHDYYDTARALGEDRDLVFTRRRFVDADVVLASECSLGIDYADHLRIDDTRFSYDKAVRSADTVWDFEPATVWFAGVRYSFVMMVERRRAADKGSRTPIWTAAELRSRLRSRNADLADYGWGIGGICERNVESWFSNRGSETEKSVLRDRGWSIAVSVTVTVPATRRRPEHKVAGWKVDTDGLGNLDFMRILDPWMAYQELSMWVGGLARPGNPTVEIASDRTRRDKHGFDRWSFRRQGTKSTSPRGG